MKFIVIIILQYYRIKVIKVFLHFNRASGIKIALFTKIYIWFKMTMHFFDSIIYKYQSLFGCLHLKNKKHRFTKAKITDIKYRQKHV